MLVIGQNKKTFFINFAKFIKSLLSMKSLKSKKKLSRFKWLYKNYLANNMVDKTSIHLENYENLIFGKNIFLQDAFIDSRDRVIVQDNVFFGWEVKILTGSHNLFSTGIKRQANIQSKPVLIEDGVWIASYSIVLPGTKIGKNSVVSAGSVVHGIFEPSSFIAGNPAKKIRKLE